MIFQVGAQEGGEVRGFVEKYWCHFWNPYHWKPQNWYITWYNKWGLVLPLSNPPPSFQNRQRLGRRGEDRKFCREILISFLKTLELIYLTLSKVGALSPPLSFPLPPRCPLGGRGGGMGFVENYWCRFEISTIENSKISKSHDISSEGFFCPPPSPTGNALGRG